MKKIILFLCTMLLVVSTVACTPSTYNAHTQTEPTPEPIITITPELAFPLDDAASIVNYTPVALKESDSTVVYHSEPIGQGDTVKVTVTQYNEVITKDSIRTEYEKIKSMRPTAETLDGIGEDAYIAYPAVHVYMDGYHISVAAGSGSDDVQHELLVNVAKMVEKNLNNILNTDG